MPMQIAEILGPDIERMFVQLMPAMQSVFADLGKGPASTQAVRFYKSFDAAAAVTPGVISCRAGCAHCCHYRVMVSPLEVFAITETISALSVNERQRIAQRVHETAVRVAKMNPEEYQRTNVECALLHDKKCSVYAARPLACRGHHAVEEAPCKAAFDNPMKPSMAKKDPRREVLLRAYENARVNVHYRAGFDMTKYELHAALSCALKNPTTFKRWKNGKAAFPDVANKASLAEQMA